MAQHTRPAATQQTFSFRIGTISGDTVTKFDVEYEKKLHLVPGGEFTVEIGALNLRPYEHLAGVADGCHARHTSSDQDISEAW